MIDTKKPIRFYDDRSKTKELVVLDKILFQNKQVCLCTTKTDGVGVVLFDKENGTVLTENLQFWYAENFKYTLQMEPKP